jgi:probable rRNA maturation factor
MAMKLNIGLAKQVDCSVDPAFVDAVVRETLERSGYAFLSSKEEVGVSVAFVGPEDIQTLNGVYRRKDRVTDVLSFPEYAGRADMERDRSGRLFLGELVLCYDYIAQAADEDGVPLEQEMAYIVSHGILHLLGFRHGKKMFGLQDEVSEPYARK